MAVKIRLKRMGKKKRPFYRIVAADSRAARDGKFIESVGTYDPIATPHKVDYKEDRILHWLSNGAQPTTTVKSLFSGKGLWLKWTLIKQGADEAKIASELVEWEKLQVEKAKRAEAKAASAAKDTAKKKAEEAKKAQEEAKAAEVPANVETEEPIVESANEAAAEPEATQSEEVKVEDAAPAVEEVKAEAPEGSAPEEKTAEVKNEDSKEKTEG